jgi:CubicO group peptidase (beta-lactamase class C family)
MVDTRFDLASLTKVFLAAVALEAVAAGRLTLDAPLTDRIPEWLGTEQAAITLRMLLAHTAGLQSGADYRTLFDHDVERYVLLRPPAAPPGERVIYSDFGFIALGAAVARGRGTALSQAVLDSLTRLGCRSTAFRPNARDHVHIPATECDAWRGRVQGRVHDEKAALMNGVAGHAGLFGTAADVARLTRAFFPRTGGVLPRSLAAEAIREQAWDPVLRRGLGWALKTTDENSCGRALSRESFGHTGFTGTSVWADPERELSIILLTNAVYYGRTDLRDVRAAVCEAAVADAAAH